jgi:hypothetical protein
VPDPNMEALAGGEEVNLTVLYITNALEHKDIMSKLGSLTETMDRVEKQTKDTNGRVAAIEVWRWLAAGAILVLIPITFFLINTALYNSGAIKKLEQMHAKELVTTPNNQEVKK